MQEERNRYLWWFAVTAVLGLGLPGFLRTGAPAAMGPSPATGPASESQPAKGVAPAAESTAVSRSFFQPLQAMLACEQPPPPLGLPDADLRSWVKGCRLADAARRRDAIVAIVPDPIDSMYEHVFDRLLEAINRAAWQAGYVRDRYYLPWQTDLAARRRDNRTGPPLVANEHETTPGLLLFRCDPPATASETKPCKPGLLAVLLVGETAAWGVHHAALDRALVIADALETEAQAEDWPLRILGPTFSGSVSSLRDALDHHPCAHAMRHTGFDVVTGEATNEHNKDVMKPAWLRDLACRFVRFGPLPRLKYRATVTDDAETMQRFYWWLAHTMGAQLTAVSASVRPCTLAGVGILTETDTVYGSGFPGRRGGALPERSVASLEECTGKDEAPRLKPQIELRYPSRVAQLRSIYERTRRYKASATQLPIDDPRRMLDLSLIAGDEADEAVPAFSDKTQLADELVFTGSLKAMCRSDLRFLGIIGVDIVNRLFLVREARRYCPNLRLFTLESDVLYAHPDVADDINGSLIVSPYPLFPQHGPWTPTTARGVIAPFGDSAAQGTYNAALRLLGQDDKGIFEIIARNGSDAPIDNELPVWVSAAGNGTLWPVAVLGAHGEGSACAAPEPTHRVQEPTARGSISVGGSAAAASASGSTGSAPECTAPFVLWGQWTWAFAAIWLTCTFVAAGYWVGRYAPRRRTEGLDVFYVFRVFRPVDGATTGAAAEHALFSLLALVQLTCAYVAVAGLVLIEHILIRESPSSPFPARLLDGVLAGCDPWWSSVPVVLTGLLLIAACADTVVGPAAAIFAAKLRGRNSDARWLHLAGLLAAGVALVAFLACRRGLVFDRSVWITLRERAINASSGLSPLVPAGVFAAAMFIAARMQLARLHHRAVLHVADPIAECEHPAVAGMPALRDDTLAIIHRFGGGRWPGTLLVVGTLAAWWVAGIPGAMTMLEGAVWNWPLTLAALAGLILALASYIPFVLGCRRLRDYLRRHVNLPCVEAFSRLPSRAAQKMSAILVQPPPVAEMQRALQQLRLLSSQLCSTRLQIDDDLRWELDRALSSAARIADALQRELEPVAGRVRTDEPACAAQQLLHGVAATLARVIASQWDRPASPDERATTTAGLAKLSPEDRRALSTAELYLRAADHDETRVWLRLAEEFVATQSVTFFHEVLFTLRRLLTTATVTALLLLAGVSSYPFERRPMLLSMMQAVVVVMVIGTVAILSGMENSEVLGRIRKSESAGKMSWNRSFVVRIAIFGILPIVSVIATKLPSVAGALFGWLPALLGVMQ